MMARQLPVVPVGNVVRATSVTNIVQVMYLLCLYKEWRKHRAGVCVAMVQYMLHYFVALDQLIELICLHLWIMLY